MQLATGMGFVHAHTQLIILSTVNIGIAWQTGGNCDSGVSSRLSTFMIILSIIMIMMHHVSHFCSPAWVWSCAMLLAIFTGCQFVEVVR